LLQVDTSNPDAALALGGAYMSNFRPALAIRALESFLRRWPTHERAAEARQTLNKLYTVLNSELNELNLPPDEAIELAVQHETVGLFLEHGKYHQGKQVAEMLLRQRPDFVPVINNLSQIHAMQGETGRAIDLCRQALQVKPDNIHALSNLARLLFLTAQPEEAAAVAEQLKASQAPAADLWSKKSEALSFLGDDEGIFQLYQQAKAAGALKLPETNALFLHLVAVASWRLGKEKEARRMWKEALKLEPGFSLAQDQLDDLAQPPSQRNGPWAFPLPNWVAEGTVRALLKVVSAAARRKDAAAVQSTARQALEQHPELAFLAPYLLQRSNSVACDFVLSLAGMVKTPELLAAIKEFALGQHGSDEQRLKASQIASGAGLFPSGTVRMWMDGEWHDLLLLNFEISDEPSAPYEDSQVQLLSEEAYHALQDRESERAQKLLEQAIALEPDSPSLWNNLAMALEMKGQSEKAQAMLREIQTRFPDYFFGIAGIARLAVKEGDYEKARALLNSLMQRKQMHYSEYDTLCMAQIDLCLAEKNKDVARTWFEMWEHPNPENPKLEIYRLRLGLMEPESILKRLSRLRK
jgi:tetratricopeptide (TPR) repeat protein